MSRGGSGNIAKHSLNCTTDAWMTSQVSTCPTLNISRRGNTTGTIEYLKTSGIVMDALVLYN